jgi:catechol 2,3-dioxygenase
MTQLQTGIQWLRSVEFDVFDLAASTAFYEETWGLSLIARFGDVAYLRGTGTEHYLVALREASTSGLRRANFGVADRHTLDALYVVLRGVAVDPPSELREPGGGYGFAFRDPEGREMRVIADVAPHERRLERDDVPIKLSHVVLNSIDVDGAGAFYQQVGFRLRDRTGQQLFLGCNAEHHCLAFGHSTHSDLNHVAFDLPSIDALMRGVGRLKRAGLMLEYGVGRHGPGDNVFAYFFDPNDIIVEYTTEMEQIDDRHYRVGAPEFWDKRVVLDEWGVAGPPSLRLREHLLRLPKNRVEAAT